MAGYVLNEQQRAELRLLENADHELTTESVLAAAKNPASTLHSLYNWDESHAANQHWLKVTREIIQSYRVVFITADDVSKSVPGYVSLVSSDQEQSSSRRVYVNTEYALSDDDLRKQLLGNLRLEIRGLQRKYGHLKEFSEILLELVERV